jgi:serine/threonine-protein kinase
MVLDRFVIRRELGRGGFGVVYQGEDTRSGKRVAIKFLHTDPGSETPLQQAARFQREGKILARFNHPSIVGVYDAGVENGRACIVMDFVEGRGLDELATQPLDWPTVVGWARSIASALAEAHSHGVVHRDIKEENIKLTTDGRIVLLDFGVAAIFEGDEQRDRATKTGMILGTWAYMSPEQFAARPLTGAADVYALGIVVYQLLTARPFWGSLKGMEIVGAVVNAATPRARVLDARPDLPPHVAAVVERCYAWDRNDRPSAAELVDLLGQLLENGGVLRAAPDARTVGATPAPSPASPSPTVRGKRTEALAPPPVAAAPSSRAPLVVGAVIAAVAVAGVVVWALTRSPAPVEARPAPVVEDVGRPRAPERPPAPAQEGPAAPAASPAVAVERPEKTAAPEKRPPSKKRKKTDEGFKW